MGLGVGSWLKDQAEDVEEFVKDPFGAEEAAEDAAKTAEQSAQQSIDAIKEQQQQIEDLYGKYYDAGTTGLAGLQTMTLGGGSMDIPESKLYEYQKDVGTRNIRRQLAARGLLDSSGEEQRLASFYGDLASEEAQRAYQDQLAQVQIGASAADRMTSASTAAAGDIGAIYGNLGQRQQAITEGAGAARAALYSGIGNTLQGLGLYLAS